MSGLSVLGLSTIILYSAPVFLTVKYIGAAYLIYLGIRLWRHGFGHSNQDNSSFGSVEPSRPEAWKRYKQGLFIALSNPKAIAFTTALFPQFIDHTQPVFVQFGILVATFMTLSFTCLAGYAYAVEKAKNRAINIKLSRLFSKIFGTAFITSGVLLMNTTQRHA